MPAILRWPGKLKAGTTSQQVLSVTDYFPTLTAAAGIQPGNTLPFDGKNLWPSIATGKIERRHDIFLSVESGGAFRSSLRDEEWKLVREVSKNDKVDQYLFHIEEDPSEQNDVSIKRPDLVKELTARSEKWSALHPVDGDRATEAPPPGWSAPKQWIEAAREA